MDQNSGPRSGAAGKRLLASNFLLELVPDQRSGESRRHRSYHHSDSYFHLPSSRGDDHRVHRQDVRALSQVGWEGGGGGGGRVEERLPAAVSNKKRLSHTKRLSLSSDQGAMGFSEPTNTPQNSILFEESPLHPGVPIVYRTPEEKSVNPDRLNLDHRHLSVCPLLEGEEKLRLLNLQHNSITRLQHLNGLRRLVFLDLYDNFVRDMSGLEGLLSLRVLMLGKNRINKISGLQTLVRLDVLDLHGNQVKDIENLSHLVHLRVLNLAGNEITCVTGLTGLSSLAELNLRRNRITNVYEIDQLPNLQRLFLSRNLIQSYGDMSCLSRCPSLLELNLDGNPLANQSEHRSSLICHIHSLHSLNQTPILEEEREEAMAVCREEEDRLKEQRRLTVVREYREAAVVAIQKSWDTQHADLFTSHSTHDLTSKQPYSQRKQNSCLASASVPHLLPTFLVDLAPPTLHLYGSGALDALDTPPRDERPLTSLHFHCVEFSDVAPWLIKIPRAFPDINSVCLECTNLTTLDQLNYLSTLPSPLHTLTITPHGNPLTHHPLFTHYTLYRLQHLQLSVFNDRPVTQDDVTTADRIFGSLGKLASAHMQPERLASLEIQHHRPKVVRGNKSIPQSSRRRSEESVDMIGLHSFPDNARDRAHQTRQYQASSLVSSLHSATLEAHRKLSLLRDSWPTITTQLVRETLRELGRLDTSMADIFNQL